MIGENGLQFGILDPDLSFLEGQNAILIDSDTRFKNEAPPETPPEKISPFFSRNSGAPSHYSQRQTRQSHSKIQCLCLYEL